MKNLCVIYLRVSTAEQAAPGHHSLEAQEILCRRYAEGRGLEVVEVLRDEGYSGRTSRRPGLRRLMEYAGPRPPAPVAAILVQDTSRMGRDTTEYLLFRRQLRERGIELVAVTQPNIDASPEGRLVDVIIAGINQYQSEEKGRRVAIAMRKKFEEGWWPGWAPLGYANGDEGGLKRVVPDPERFHLVRLGFGEYATQEQLRDGG
jgi:DNA invertase Pin-like site-specific DNA recombinase